MQVNSFTQYCEPKQVLTSILGCCRRGEEIWWRHQHGFCKLLPKDTPTGVAYKRGTDMTSQRLFKQMVNHSFQQR